MSFENIYRLKSVQGIISLRRKQFQVAMDGNTSMLMFLGKQYLSQESKISTVHHIQNESIFKHEYDKKPYSKAELREMVWGDSFEI